MDRDVVSMPDLNAVSCMCSYPHLGCWETVNKPCELGRPLSSGIPRNFSVWVCVGGELVTGVDLVFSIEEP